MKVFFIFRYLTCLLTHVFKSTTMMKPHTIYLLMTTLLTTLNTQALAADKPPLVQGLDHLGLAVKDLNQTTDFFVQQLSFKVVGEDPEYPARFLNNGTLTITLWQTTAGETVAFNRKQNVGLHHLALAVPSLEALQQLYQRIKDLDGVVIEFKPELFYGGPSQHMMIREPSGNRIEFIYRQKP